jgi:hypothetical protein
LFISVNNYNTDNILRINKMNIYFLTMNNTVKFLFLNLLLILPLISQAAGIAMVTDLQGKANVTIDGKSREITILSEFPQAAQVQLSAGANLVTMYLDTGEEYAFKGPASIIFKPGQPEVISGAKPEKRNNVLGKAGSTVRIKSTGVVQGAMVMRGGKASAKIRLLNLLKTKTLESQPEFLWQEVQGGGKYHFELIDDAGRLLHETDIKTPSLKLPASVELKESITYSWTITHTTDDGRKLSGSGDFSLASVELRALANDLKPTSNSPLATRISYAAWLDQMDLKDEAKQYWKAAALERPEDIQLKALAEK